METKRMWLLVPALAALVLVAVFLMGTGLQAAAGQAGSGLEPRSTASSLSWSSGWTYVPAGTCQGFEHNLGGSPSDYTVELWFLDLDNNLGINRRGYGGLEVGGYWRGAYWQQLTANNVEVCRHADDMWADQLLVRVWRLPKPPDFDSGWQGIAPGTTLVISHHLGISATELNVGLWFSSTARGIHQAGYGGLSDGTAKELHGAYWKNLTEDTVRVARMVDDTLVEQVRVVVSRADPPSYDSLEALGGWQDLPFIGEVTFQHNLNWPPHLQLVRVECKSVDFPGPGIHQIYAGGNQDWFIGWQGAYIENVEQDQIIVQRMVNDQVCPQARIRIWQRAYRTFLPLLLQGSLE